MEKIEFGHLIYVAVWTVTGISFGLLSFSQRKKKLRYRDVIVGTLGISFEAVGVEIGRGSLALMVPLCIGMLLSLLARFMPEDTEKLTLLIGTRELKGASLYFWIFFLYTLLQSMLLLLAYRGWLDNLIKFPG